MTYTDKPKRKRKEKPKRSRRSRIIVLLIAILMVIGMGVYLMLPESLKPPPDVFNVPDGDPFTPLCEFDADVYIYVPTTYASYITQLGDDTVHLLGTSNITFNSGVDGSPYVWLEQQQEHLAFNLETHTLTAMTLLDRSTTRGQSPSNRYMVRMTWNDNNVNYIAIGDAQTGERILHIQTSNRNWRWSTDEHYVLLYRRDALRLAQIFDTRSKTLESIDLPSDVQTIYGWISETTIVYLSTGGYLRQWNVIDDVVDNVFDVRFDASYLAGGTRFSPNVRGYIDLTQSLGGMDRSGNFLYADFRNPDVSHVLPMDTSRKLSYTVHDGLVVFEFEDSQDGLLLYYTRGPYAGEQVNITPITSSLKFSPTGRYAYYWEQLTPYVNTYTIQDMFTQDTIVFDDPNSSDFGWHNINGTDYILYGLRTEDDTSVFYLFNPQNQERCKLGTFYAPRVELIVGA